MVILNTVATEELLTTGFICFLELFQGMRRGWWAVEMTCTSLALGDFRWDAEKWVEHLKKNFFINNSVGLSMCGSLIENVKYIWVGEYLMHA